jgi:hypothetical protein
MPRIRDRGAFGGQAQARCDRARPSNRIFGQ